MATAVKKTISLPPELAKEVEEIALEEGKTLSAVIQDALRLARKERLKKEFYQVQDYWSRKAKEKGILTEKDLASQPLIFLVRFHPETPAFPLSPSGRGLG
ncbi:MAG: ribbon-helix-helix protein, CopG family [Thermodesulfobacteriota bacterium]